ncbi:MAG: SufS family cysteine desulfurase [Thermoanaerobaculum sp.]|nr:SufS family cysteine desulfurase [Thermoanaerobaculum sp.]
MTSTTSVPVLRPQRVAERFPILQRTVRGRRLVYLDNAATTQKPREVLEALQRFYSHTNANVHRGAYTLSEEATAAFEQCRERVAQWVHAPDPRGVVILRNTTEAINLVAQSWSRRLAPGDEILTTEMEHHSNLVPWLMVAKERGLVLRHVPITEEGELDLAAFRRLLSRRTRVVAVTGMSNVLGTIVPVPELVEEAHKVGAIVVVDGAQLVPHQAVHFGQLGCDFLAFSAHKMYGPTGVGFLVGKPELLEAMEPVLGGGEMIREVFLDRATWNDIPHKFEAGTPNIADAAAFPAALGFLEELTFEAIRAHEQDLTAYAWERLAGLGGLTLHGPKNPSRRGALISFVDEHIHPHDLATVLDTHGVAVRAGHHCAQPLMRRLGVVASVRASFAVYNSREDVDALVFAILAARRFFGLA